MARQRQVYDTDMVAHLWANQSQESARNPLGNFYFTGETLYSYGSHFPVARIVQRKGKGTVVLLNSSSYSVTTSKHQSLARSASRQFERFTVPALSARWTGKTDLPKESHAENLEFYSKSIAELATKIVRARANKQSLIGDLELTITQANRYSEFFGLRKTFKAPAGYDSEAMKALARQESAKRDAREKREQTKREKERQERIAKTLEYLDAWKRGESVPVSFHEIPDTYLRVRVHEEPLENEHGMKEIHLLETSRGAEVPLDHALRVLPRIRSGVPYEHNGHSIHLGHFRIDAIDALGNVRAGCHFIKREEIERIAAELGV